MYIVQSVLFDDSIWSVLDSANWLLNHDYKVLKIDESNNPVFNGLICIRTSVYENNREIYMKEHEGSFYKGKQIYFKKILF